METKGIQAISNSTACGALVTSDVTFGCKMCIHIRLLRAAYFCKCRSFVHAMTADYTDVDIIIY